jgi:hypothetical protein
MKLKLILTILICLISLKCVQNESCLNWNAWKNYTLEFQLNFYNKTLELIA